MRKTIAVLFALCALAGVVAIAQDDHGHESTTVKGEVLDLACYVAHEAQGADHASCAKRCVQGGQPMGLLAEDGTVYLLFANHKDGAPFEKTKEYAGQVVEVTGVVSTQAGIHGLEVQGVKQP